MIFSSVSLRYVAFFCPLSTDVYPSPVKSKIDVASYLSTDTDIIQSKQLRITC